MHKSINFPSLFFKDAGEGCRREQAPSRLSFGGAGGAKSPFLKCNKIRGGTRNFPTEG